MEPWEFAGDAAADSEPQMTASKYCSGCGVKIHLTARQCPRCGAHQAGSGSQRSRVTAALFAIFLGGLGVHKFYLGRPGMGVLYLLFCWTFIPALVGFIEGLVMLASDDASFAATYG